MRPQPGGVRIGADHRLDRSAITQRDGLPLIDQNLCRHGNLMMGIARPRALHQLLRQLLQGRFGPQHQALGNGLRQPIHILAAIPHENPLQ